MHRQHGFRALLRVVALGAVSLSAAAADAEPEPGDEIEEIEEIVVQGVAPLPGAEIDRALLAANAQRASKQELQRSRAASFASFLEHRMGSVHVNEAQGNVLQPDLGYRGYVASPLLGVPQGLAVYQDGVRLNESFGDTVNWDLVPQIALEQVELIPGADPLFGLNALGGAIVLRTKDGFSSPRSGGRLSGGSFGRIALDAESGANDGTLGYYLAARYFDEDGWRDRSPSRALNLFGALSWRGPKRQLDLRLGFGDTDLIGNGATPAQLLTAGRGEVFTFPDQTRNRLVSVSAHGSQTVWKGWSLSALAYYRDLDTRTENGDATEFADCELPANAGLLCEDEGAGTADEEVVRDRDARAAGSDLDAVNNRSATDQNAFGFTVQSRLDHSIAGAGGTLVGGFGYSGGRVEFGSSVELARLTSQRGTRRTRRFVPTGRVAVQSEREVWSAYATEMLSPLPDLTLHAGARLVSTSVELRDRSGLSPALDGSHGYFRVNPAFGLRYRAAEPLTLFAAYRESSRTPSPVELACASPSAPCNLPNAFLADPPLDQVVARSLELGLRGHWRPYLEEVRFSAFASRAEDDILFISSGGVTGNEGFFDNVGDTFRRGFELGLEGSVDAADLHWQLDYSFVLASFEDGFAASSPSHPRADANGEVRVRGGDRIPSIPEHMLKWQLDWIPTDRIRLGLALRFYSDQHLRGDEANLLQPIDAYALVGLRGEWRVWKQLSVFAEVENLFDHEYETFGLLGEPGEVLGPAFDDPRFLSPGAPIGFWIGVAAWF